jgi:hypothetical protein
MFLVTTESGARYLFSEGLATVKRLDHDWTMPYDGEWLRIISSQIGLGERMLLELISEDGSFHVLRDTTPVVNMEYIDSQRADDLLN